MVRHTMTRYGTFLICFLATSAVGCSSLILSNTPVQGENASTREIARTPIDVPEVTLTPHHDQQRLTIRVTQRSQITLETDTPMQAEARRYVFSPTAPLAGAVHCPVLTVAYVISAGHLGSQSLAPACRRLLMQEPLAGSPRVAAEIEHRYETHTTTEPVRYATLRVAWDDAIHPPLVYDVNPDGEVSIPQHALRSGTERDPSTLPTLSILVDNRVLWTHRLTPSEMTPSGPLPDEPHTAGTSWPPIVALVLEPLDGAAPPTLRAWGRLVTQALLERHICVVAPITFAKDLQDELLLHQSGRISDQTAVHFGKWIPATVALTIRNGAANQGIAILEFVDIQRAERIRYDVLRYSSDWKEDAQMLKAYMQTVFPKGYQSCS